MMRATRIVRSALPLILLVLPLFRTTVRPQEQARAPLVGAFRFRSIGPASMGGRIDDIAVSESDPNVIYIGYAVGGVFKSENNGTTFVPVFDTYTTASIGDIAIHPTNPNIVYVAVPGHLFGPNRDRGVYKTTDGGRTWNNVKFIDEDTGFTDIAIDPSNSNTLYAASYQRRRSGCCFNGGGPGSALWKTTDAGRTWNKLAGNGLPPGTYGRIALDVSRSNPNVVYAQIEAGETGAPSTTAAVDPGAT